MKKFYVKKETTQEEEEQTSSTDIAAENSEREGIDDIEVIQNEPRIPTEFLNSSGTPYKNENRQMKPLSPPQYELAMQACNQMSLELNSGSGATNFLKESLNKYRTEDIESCHVEHPALPKILYFPSTSSGSRTLQRIPTSDTVSQILYVQSKENERSSDTADQEKLRMKIVSRPEDFVPSKVNPQTSSEFLDSPGTSSGSRTRRKLPARPVNDTFQHASFSQERKLAPDTGIQQDSMRGNYCFGPHWTKKSGYQLLNPSLTPTGTKTRYARNLSDTFHSLSLQENKLAPEALRNKYRTETRRDESLTQSGFITSGERPNQQRLPDGSPPGDANTRRRKISLCDDDQYKPRRGSMDRFDVIGKMVSIKLRDLPKDQMRWAEKFIYDVLFEAEDGNLHAGCAFQCRRPLVHPSSGLVPQRLHPVSNFALPVPISTAPFHGTSVPNRNLDRSHSLKKEGSTAIVDPDSK